MLTSIHLTNIIRMRKAPLGWALRNALRPSYIAGWLVNQFAVLFSKMTGIITMTAEWHAVKKHNGEYIDYGVVGYRCVTSAGVAFIVDGWQNSVELEIMKYIGVGTGAVAEATSDTALGTECTTVLNPDNTRATGTLGEGATSNILSVTGTNTFDNTASITEVGIFSQAATGGGTLFDRSVVTAIPVVATDTITWTYQLTLNAGG